MLGGAAVARPVVARAQQATMPVIGFLNPTSEASFREQIEAFRRGLKEVGYVEGQNVRIEYRWAQGNVDQLPQLAADLVRQRVSVIAATGEIRSAKAAQAATNSIPTVFTIGADPVPLGLVSSWNSPGGNITGIVILATQLVRKEVEILNEILPPASSVGLLLNPENAGAAAEKDGEAAAQQLGRRLVVVMARTPAEINLAIEKLVQERVAALAVVGDPLFLSRRAEILGMTAQNKLAVLWPNPDAARMGVLVGLGHSVPDAYQESGVYVGRVLKGARPQDLPVIQASNVSLTINLKTAKALGLTIPPALLARADEVIE